MPEITLGTFPGKENNSKLAKSMQQYNLTYSGRAPIENTQPLDFLFCRL